MCKTKLSLDPYEYNLIYKTIAQTSGKKIIIVTVPELEWAKTNSHVYLVGVSLRGKKETQNMG